MPAGQRTAVGIAGMALRVAVLIDLYRHPAAGGHVKSWERLAERAADAAFAGTLDLTVFMLGDAERSEALAGHSRIVQLPPGLSTKRLPFLRNGGGDTDLLWRHPGIEPRLEAFDVLHVTDTFAFARSATRVARRQGLGLAYSIQTDLPRFTEVYAREILERALPSAGLRELLLDRAGLPRHLAVGARRKVERMIRAADRVLVSRQEDAELVERLRGADRLRWFRRGADRRAFSPELRDRAALERGYGVPQDRVVLLFVGRVDPSKQVMTAVAATERLIEAGRPVHLVVAGEGTQRAAVAERLGAAGSTPGFVPHAELGRLCAASDVFVFPSESETYGNVLNEAALAGLPPVFSSACTTIAARTENGADGLVIDGQDPAVWAEAIGGLVDDPERRAEMGRKAREKVQATVPGWREVLDRDLLPVWQELAELKRLPRAA